MKPELFYQSSLSDPKKKPYAVRKLVVGNEITWRCSCPQSVLKNKTCKHIIAVRANKIINLQSEIAYTEDSIARAEEYPTETTQFYAALAREKNKLEELEEELLALERS